MFAPPATPATFQEPRLHAALCISLSLGFVFHECCRSGIHGGGAVWDGGEDGIRRGGAGWGGVEWGVDEWGGGVGVEWGGGVGVGWGGPQRGDVGRRGVSSGSTWTGRKGAMALASDSSKALTYALSSAMRPFWKWHGPGSSWTLGGGAGTTGFLPGGGAWGRPKQLQCLPHLKAQNG
jgi:hypothetical protein